MVGVDLEKDMKKRGECNAKDTYESYSVIEECLQPVGVG